MKQKKGLFHQDNAPYHKSIATVAKLHFELLPHPPYSLDLAHNDFYLFKDLNRMLQGKRFGSNVEVITVTESYLEGEKNRSTKKASKY